MKKNLLRSIFIFSGLGFMPQTAFCEEAHDFDLSSLKPGSPAQITQKIDETLEFVFCNNYNEDCVKYKYFVADKVEEYGEKTEILPEGCFSLELDSKFSPMLEVDISFRSLFINFFEKQEDGKVNEIIEFLKGLLKGPFPYPVKYIYLSIPSSHQELKPFLKDLGFSSEKELLGVEGGRFSQSFVFYKKIKKNSEEASQSLPGPYSWKPVDRDNKKNLEGSERIIEIPAEGSEKITKISQGQKNAEVQDYYIFIRKKGAKKVIGGAQLTFYSSLTKDVDSFGDVYKLFIKENHRGKHLGSQLIKQAERLLKEKGAHFLTIETSDHFNHKFYERMGYERFLTYKHSDGCQADGTCFSQYIFRKNLT